MLFGAVWFQTGHSNDVIRLNNFSVLQLQVPDRLLERTALYNIYPLAVKLGKKTEILQNVWDEWDFIINLSYNASACRPTKTGTQFYANTHNWMFCISCILDQLTIIRSGELNFILFKGLFLTQGSVISVERLLNLVDFDLSLWLNCSAAFHAPSWKLHMPSLQWMSPPSLLHAALPRLLALRKVAHRPWDLRTQKRWCGNHQILTPVTRKPPAA